MKLLARTLFVVAVISLMACNKDESTGAANAKPSSSSALARSEKVTIGEMAPALFVENSLNNEDTVPNLDDLIGKVVVLDYWTYW